MYAQTSLMAELEDAIRHGSSDRRIATLRRVTNLFLMESERLNEDQIQVFDEILCHLMARMEARVLAELGERLAPIHNAPVEAIRALARHDEIAVAGPVIAISERLTPQDLVDIARTKGRHHLLAICKRKTLSEPVTDALIERGDAEVVSRLVDNAGASFSDSGYTRLVEKAHSDETLSEGVGLRADIPLHIFRDLLEHTTDSVRSRLLLLASTERREEIRAILQGIPNGAPAGDRAVPDFAESEQHVRRLNEAGQLNQLALLEFVHTGRYAESVVALALMCGAPIELIERIFNDARSESLLIPCKAADLSWMTLRALILLQSGRRGINAQDLGKIKNDYVRLSQVTAQRVLRFWATEQTLRDPDSGPGDKASA
jgi:uncharacterized protein (DUF2336 family)